MDELLPLIAWIDLQEGRGRHVRTNGLDLAVFRVGDAVYAIDDSCPHAGGSLANGRLQGTRVLCPVHGLCIELDPDAPPGPAALNACRHAVQVIDGMVTLMPT
jgi:3-phenylpropionate/trans-cinnamate dioxygenase ferredoxin subunit